MKHTLPGLKMTRPVSIFLLRQASIFLCGADTLGTDMTLQRTEPTLFLPTPTQERKSLDFAFYVSEHRISSSSTQFMVRCCLDMACLVCGWARRGKQETKTLCSSYWYTKSSLTVSSPGCAYLEEAIWLMPCKYSVKTVCSAKLETCTPARER